MLANDTLLGVGEGTRLHRWPTGALCFYQDNGEVMTELNETAVEVLLCIDGSTRLNQLIQDIERRYPDGKDVRQTVCSFLEQAVSWGVVVANEYPQPKHIQCTGSTTYYAPVHVMFELTRDCNLRCAHCYNNSGLVKHARMDTETLLNLMTRLGNEGVRMAELTGGEPLVHPDFDRILEHASQVFPGLALLSNGWMVNPKRAALIGRLKDQILVQIDLDGSSPETHDELRGAPGAFEMAKRAVRLLADQDVHVRVAMTVTPKSVRQIKATMALARELGAQYFAFTPVMAVGRGREFADNPLTADDVRHLIEAARWADEHYPGFVFRVSDQAKERWKEVGNCGAGYQSYVIDPVGDVRPCPLMAEFGMSMGNVLESGFEGVFGGRAPDYLKNLSAPNAAACQECASKSACQGCILAGIVQYSELGDACGWAVDNRLDEYLTSGSAQSSITPGCTLPTRGEYVFNRGSCA